MSSSEAIFSSAVGASRHFAARQQFGRFWSNANISWTALRQSLGWPPVALGEPLTGLPAMGRPILLATSSSINHRSVKPIISRRKIGIGTLTRLCCTDQQPTRAAWISRWPTLEKAS
jgi:hypothetical protein